MLLTVIALCHNHAPFLRAALDSILAQDYAPLEVWLVDNGSQDESPAILREYAAQNPAWHLLLLPANVGNCRAFNQAFGQSRGEWVVDLATDDALLPGRLSRQVAFLRTLPATCGMVYANCELVDERGHLVRLHHRPDPARPGQLVPAPASGWVWTEILRRYFISTPTMLMRAATLRAMGGYDEALSYEDFDFWVRAGRDWQFFYQDEVLTRKTLHPRSLSAQATRRHDPHQASTLAVLTKALTLCRTRTELRALAGRLRHELAHALRRGQWAEVRRAAGLLVQIVGWVVGLRGQAE